METYDQPLTFEQPLESGRLDVIQWFKKCGLVSFCRKAVSRTFGSDAALESQDTAEVAEETAEPISIYQRVSSLGISEQISSELEVKIHKFLSDNFGLGNNDVADEFIADVILRSKGNPKFIKRILQLKISETEDVLRKALSQSAESTKGVKLERRDLNNLVREYRPQILQAANNGKTFNLVEGVKYNQTVTDLAIFNEKTFKVTKGNRNEALRCINDISEYAEVIKSWDENPCALSDADMSNIFHREKADNRLLTTFFDTAQFGLVNKFLAERAEKRDRDNPDFQDFVISQKRAIVEHFEPFDEFSGDGARRFIPENSIFTRNGTKAFGFLYDNYFKDGDSVLTTSEEYGEMVHMIGDKKKNIKLNTLPVYEDKESYLRDFADMLGRNPKINYILVSAVSRRGSVFPLKEMNETRRTFEAETGRRIHLIVDGCQAAGRRVLDFNDFEPDVFIASSQKGTDFGGPVGFLALSSDFINEKGKIEYDEAGNESAIYLQDSNNEEIGTLNKTDMARFALGMNPRSLDKVRIPNIKKTIIDKMLLSVEERQSANHDLACRFAELARVINKKTKGRFKILYPTMIYGSSGKLNEYRLSNIFECRIKGLERKDVIERMQDFGVTIQDFFDEAEPGVSFRIALHPFMNNNSLKILGFALHECCAVAQRHEQRARKEAVAA